MPYTFESKSGFDTEYYSNLLKKDEDRIASKEIPDPKVEEVKAYEMPNGDSDSIQDILERNTFKGLPPAAMTVIKQANQIKSSGKSKSVNQVSEVFLKLFDELNNQYGFNINIDFNSFSRSLEYIISPRNKQALELFISEAFSRTKALLFSMYLNSVTLLSAQLLDPDYILSDSLSYQDKFIIVEKLYFMMTQLTEICDKVNIPDAGLKLEKLAGKNDVGLNINKEEVRNFLEAFSQIGKN
jgi:hypothetical protein